MKKTLKKLKLNNSVSHASGEQFEPINPVTWFIGIFVLATFLPVANAIANLILVNYTFKLVFVLLTFVFVPLLFGELATRCVTRRGGGRFYVEKPDDVKQEEVKWKR